MVEIPEVHEGERRIPADIMRAVRQRALFGCVICGAPFIEYHHIEPWSVVHRHDVQNITALCPNHHHEATGPNPTLPEREVVARTEDPYNAHRDTTDPHPLRYGPGMAVRMANQNFVATPPYPLRILAIDGFHLADVSFEDGYALLTVMICDQSNRPVLAIVDNAIQISPSAWDVQWVANRLRVRSGHHRVIFDATFDVTANVVEINVADFRLNGLYVRTRPGLVERVREAGDDSTEIRMFSGGAGTATRRFVGTNNWFQAAPNAACLVAGVNPFPVCGVFLGDNTVRAHGFSHPTTWGLQDYFYPGPAALGGQGAEESPEPQDVERDAAQCSEADTAPDQAATDEAEPPSEAPV